MMVIGFCILAPLLWAQDRLLTIEERIAAVRGQFTEVSNRFEAIALAFLSLAILALVVSLGAFTVTQWRRYRILRQIRRDLAEFNLFDDELELFSRISRHASLTQLRDLAGSRGLFDRAAARFLNRLNGSRRLASLGPVLSLRRRLPVAQNESGDVPVAVGTPLTVRVRRAEGSIMDLKGYVLGRTQKRLQIGLADAPADLPPLPGGQRVRLYLQQDREVLHSVVRIRGRCLGNRVQLLLDEPQRWTPARIQVPLRPVRSAVQVELLERFPDSLQSEVVPVVTANISAVSSQGIVLTTDAVKIREGESIRIAEGPFAGRYRRFVPTQGRGRVRSYFLFPQRSEPAKTAAAVSPSAQDKEENRTPLSL